MPRPFPKLPKRVHKKAAPQSEATLAQALAGRRVGLVLSAGYFGFFGHAGFLGGLLAAGLRPAAYAGTSAGGLVSAFAAAGLQPEALEALVLGLRRESFFDVDVLGGLADAARGGTGGMGLLAGRRFRTLLESALPVRRFEECPTPLLLVAADVKNACSVALTTGELAPAIHATCAYPGLFRPVPRGEALLWDGGLVDKAPALALSRHLPGALDALLVHLLPTRGEAALGGPFAYARGLSAGVAALRRSHLELQCALLAAEGLVVYLVVSELPRVSARSLHKGPEAVAAGRAAAQRALAQPAQSLRPSGPRAEKGGPS
ncbi:MAG: patatin-like phospholipase family protein [Myxococcaceae bacterium]